MGEHYVCVKQQTCVLKGCLLFALTVTIRVDSALATRTNTSASRQCWSIHKSRSGLTSIPGL